VRNAVQPGMSVAPVGRLARTGRAWFAVVLYLSCAFAPAAASDDAVTRAEFDALKKEVSALRAEIGALRQTRAGVARAAPPPPTAQASTAGAPTLGSADASVVMVEFTDLRCPYCRRFHATVFPELKRLYIDTGKLRYVVKDLPLDIHPQAEEAAVAAYCAGRQGNYWPMRERLVQHAQPFKSGEFLTLAASLSLDIERFQGCLADPRSRSTIERDKAEAAGQRITGTPTFVIGRARADGSIAGTRLIGALPAARFVQEIDSLLRTAQR